LLTKYDVTTTNKLITITGSGKLIILFKLSFFFNVVIIFLISGVAPIIATIITTK
jgi:hypothetical protein